MAAAPPRQAAAHDAYSFERATKSGFVPIASPLAYSEPVDIAAGWDGSVFVVDAAGAPHVYDSVQDRWAVYGAGIDAGCVFDGVPYLFRGPEVFVADDRHPTTLPIGKLWPGLPDGFKLGVKGAAVAGGSLYLFRSGQYLKAPAPLSEGAGVSPGGVVLAALGAGCAAREGNDATPGKEPVTLSLTSAGTNGAVGVRTQTLERWATQFPTVNPRVRAVEVVGVPNEGTSAGDFNIKVQTMYAAGAGPDVSMHIWPLDPSKLLLNLDPYLKQKGFAKADFWWSKYYQEGADGRTYSLPLNAAAWGMIVNVDLFERAGLKLPTKDWTYNDLRDAARKLASDRVWGFERTTGTWEMYSQFAGEGAEWYDRQALKTTLHLGKDGGKPQEMFEDWWGFVWRDRLAPNPEDVRQVRANSGVARGALFSTGLVGIASQAFHQISTPVTEIGDRFRYRVVWPPRSVYSGRRGYHTEVNSIVTNKQSRAPDEAFELNHYWLSDDMQRFVAVNQPVMPPGRKWHRSKEVVDSAPGMDIWGDVADEAQKIGNDRHKWNGGTGSSPKSLEWLNAVNGALIEDALTRGGEPRAALREALLAGDRALA